MSEPKPLHRSEEADPREELNHIRAMIRSVLVIQEADLEELAADLWIEFWQNDMRPTMLRVRSRCYDWLRKRKVRKEGPLPDVLVEQPPELIEDGAETEAQSDDSELVTTLIDSSDLTPQDRRILWMVFYSGESPTVIARTLGLTPERLELRISEIILSLQHFARRLVQ